MKRRTALWVTCALVVALLTAFESHGTAQSGNRVRRAQLSTGAVSLGPNQIVRLTVANASNNGTARRLRVNLRTLQHAPTSQQAGVVKHTVFDDTEGAETFLMPGESVTKDFDLTGAASSNVRAVSFDISLWATFPSDVRAAVATSNLSIIDRITGEVLGVWVWCEAEGGYIWM